MPDLPKQLLPSRSHQQPGAQSLDVLAVCAKRPWALGSLLSKDNTGTWAGEQALAHCVSLPARHSCLCLISHLEGLCFFDCRAPCCESHEPYDSSRY